MTRSVAIRAPLRTALLATLAAAFAAGRPALAQSTFHGDNARTGVYAAPGPATFGGVAWTFKAGGPIVASPTLADGVVYISSLDRRLYAVDQETGKEKWTFESRMPIASSPAIADGAVYFVSSTGSLAALDAATGSPKWVFAAEYERRFEAPGLHGYPPAKQTIPDAWDLFTSSPAAAGGKVYFGCGDGNVYAVDAATGLLQWKFPTGGVVHASPAVVKGVVYVGSWDGRLYAIDAETGLQRWAFQTGEDPVAHNQVGFQSSPAVVNGVVYVGCRDAHVYAVDAATGRKKWDYPTSKSWVIGTPAVRDGVVYAGTSDTARFMALDAKSGRLRWNATANGYIFSSPALAGGLAYFGDHSGTLHAVDLKSGRTAWQFRTDAAKADPLRVLNADGTLNRAGFTPVFHDFQDMYVDFYRFVSIGAIMSSPVVDRGTVYVGSLDGNLYAIR
ncbi:MAG TPA: PQQ-binding-like beta-propeller repeat protein [Acidobacteriota bacterium]|nr:PQQ-binding-like beta-propeller repeat protein [Acidobacteriota bacterium]